MRAGIIAEKLGMTRIFDENGQHIPVTVLQMRDCEVTDVKSDHNHYNYVQIGAFKKKLKQTTKSLKGFFAKQKVEPKKVLVDFRVDDLGDVKPGDQVSAEHFSVNQKLDVTSYSKGAGFAGVMKRHNFGGGRASHGVSKAHRTHGSTGQCQDPGRVFKGKKMAGQLGNVQVTKQNLKLVKVDSENHLLFVKGSIPGSKGAVVIVRDAIKCQHKGFTLLGPVVVRQDQNTPNQESAN